ncbi:hypothetical protein AA0114_g6765 [Alternaria tenuissima]|uniref:F-box domain-containing protein n=1 Tax=Alternaria tenuissima TaxID=119927 RepID=A0A4Q4MEM4_9PLEO|nr:hypothetical protein AA0114_g6765 [Alternaria tenuissima]
MSILQMPTELVETVAQYLCDPDLLEFRSTCRFADSNTSRAVGRRFFSTLNTTLISSDIDRLETISQSGRLARYVKTIQIKDDGANIREHLLRTTPPPEEAIPKGWKLREQKIRKMRRECRSWPREKPATLDSDMIAVSKIQTILQKNRFLLDALIIRGVYESFGADKEATIALALETVSTANLGITSLRVETMTMWVTKVTFRFDQRNQNQKAGFSILREAHVEMENGPASIYLLNQLLYHAPVLGDLTLEGLDARGRCAMVPFDTYVKRGVPLVKLKRLRLARSSFPAGFIQEILCNSRHTLQEIELVTVRLDYATGLAWKKLLLYIGKDFPALSHFKLSTLKHMGRTLLDSSDIPEMLEATCEGELGVYSLYHGHVEFRGSNASHALQIVASHLKTSG